MIFWEASIGRNTNACTMVTRMNRHYANELWTLCHLPLSHRKAQCICKRLGSNP
ncbi:MAG: hypothetical protein IKM77_04315 [Prevotella sp.]|nr:hypothetical protein [Prevotella sp.]